ncbi:MAG TPA: hypothetical protein VFF76_06535 [Holophagaceae bacterium]|jgi:hypothetical protein|nr:hypothetical protein [Holophagaceae bacterium]
MAGMSLLLVLSLAAGSVPVKAQTAAPAKNTKRPEPAAAAKSETVMDDVGRFVATFPGPVQRRSQQVDTAVGKIPMNMVFVDHTAEVYMIIYCDYPEGSVARSGGAESVCSNARDGAVKNVNGKVRTSTSCRIGELNGLEVVADIPPKDPKTAGAPSASRLRFFVVGDRLYQLMYIGPNGTEASTEAMAFLNSIRLTR